MAARVFGLIQAAGVGTSSFQVNGFRLDQVVLPTLFQTFAGGGEYVVGQ